MNWVKLLPHVDSGFPKLMVPDFTLLKTDTSDIIILGLTCALVIMAQTLLATNNYANRYGYKVDNNREVLAYSLANIASSVSGSCPLNGSVSRTGIADQFGCKSQLMSVTASITMLVVVLFATPVLEYLPVPILTGIVVAALIGIVEYKLADKLRKVNRAEFFIFLAAMFGVLLFGTIYGVIIGVILSFIAVIIRAVVPPRSFLGCIPGHEGFYNLNRNKNALQIEHTLLYRFSGNLFFANVSTFLQDIENAINDDTKIIIVDASGIGSIDITAADRLVSFNKILKGKGIHFYITEHVDHVNDQLRQLGAGCLVEEGVTRDAGVDRPYPLVGSPEQVAVHEDFIEDNERLAEIEWAFGKDAAEWLDKYAVQVTDDITSSIDGGSSELAENVLDKAESKNAWGRIGLFDEDELLERVEMHLSELAQNSNAEELEEHIEQRRLRLEAKIAKLNPDALKHLREHRKEVLQRFKENNPEAYAHMIQHRKEHISRLEKEKPELAAKMKEFYKLDD